MRLATILLIAQLLTVLIFPVTAIANFPRDIKNTHQNKNDSINIILQGNVKNAINKHEDRKILTKKVFSVHAKQESEIKENNSKRLVRYKSYFEDYIPPKGEMEILVTGYSSTSDQTWGNPFNTASGTHVHKGTMACPPQYPFGTKVKVKNKGTFVCEDRGGMIKGNHFDMWFESKVEALQWGKRMVVATIEK